MEFVYAILVMVSILISVVGIRYAQSKGIIKIDNVSNLKKAEQLIPIVAELTRQFTKLPQDKVEIVEDVLEDIIDYVILTIENKTFLTQDELKTHSLDLINDLNIELSEDDINLFKSVISVIYLYLK